VSDVGVVTFDGPAASGKSSVALRVGAALELPVVSSGLLYRAATLLAERSGAPVDDADALLVELRSHRVDLVPDLAGNRVSIDDEDVTAALHTDEVDALVSAVAAHEGVRAWVTECLRTIPPPFVIDGRDMGSVVFPRARHKFYLTASPEVRATRRVGERAADLERVADAIRRRDRLDAKQLAPAPDAEWIDTDGLALDEVVDLVLTRMIARRSS
jgi:CMP/dCMP kinase